MSLVVGESQKPVRYIFGDDGKRYQISQPYMRCGTIFVNTLSEEDGILSTMIFRMYPTDTSIPVTIDWGDGALSNVSVEEGQNYTPIVKHTYKAYGEYNVEIDNSISALNIWNGGYEYIPDYSYSQITYENKSITKLRRFGTNLKYLLGGCFSKCSHLSVWNLENSKVQQFGSGANHKISPFGAFRGTSPKMKRLILNDNVRSIGGTVFGEMGTNIIEIDLSRCKDLSSLGAYSFYSTPNVCSIKLPPISFNTPETRRAHYFRRCGRAQSNGGSSPFYSLRFPEEMENAPSEFFSQASKLSSISVNKAFLNFSDTSFEGTSISEIEFRDRRLEDIPSIYQIGRWGPESTVSCHFTDCEALMNIQHGDLSVLCDDGQLSLHFAQPRDLTATVSRVIENQCQCVNVKCYQLSSFPMFETKSLRYEYTGCNFDDESKYMTSVVYDIQGEYVTIPDIKLQATDKIISSDGQQVDVSAFTGTLSVRCVVEYIKDFFYKVDMSSISILSTIASAYLYPYDGSISKKPSFSPSPSDFSDWTYTPTDLQSVPAEDE